MDGMLERARELLDQAVEAGAGRRCSPTRPTTPGSREAQLDALPPADRPAPCASWRTTTGARPRRRRRTTSSATAAARGARPAVPRDEAGAARTQRTRRRMQALKDMMADLNAMLEKHAARRAHRSTTSTTSWTSTATSSPTTRRRSRSCVDQLARQAAAMQRMLDSMTPEQRQELAQLMDQALGDLDLASEMGRLGRPAARAAPRPAAGAAASGCAATSRSASATPPRRSRARRPRRAVRGALGQDYAGASLDDVDEEAVARALGPRRPSTTSSGCSEIERELERQGYLTRVRRPARADRRRRSAGSARPRCAGSSPRSRRARRGDHDVHDAGAAGELTGTDARSGASATSSRSTSCGPCPTPYAAAWSTADSPLLRPEDFEIRRPSGAPGGGRAARRPVVLDGHERHLAHGEDHRDGAARAGHDAVPARRAWRSSRSPTSRGGSSRTSCPTSTPTRCRARTCSTP